LWLTVTLAPSEPVPGLYLHPEHRRRTHSADHGGPEVSSN
jgi:hypothetical protein